MVREQNDLVIKIRELCEKEFEEKAKEIEKDMEAYESIMVNAKTFSEIQCAYELRQKLAEKYDELAKNYRAARLSASMVSFCECLYGDILLKDSKTNQVPIKVL